MLKQIRILFLHKHLYNVASNIWKYGASAEELTSASAKLQKEKMWMLIFEKKIKKEIHNKYKILKKKLFAKSEV